MLLLNPCIGGSIHCKMKCVRNWEKSLQGKSQELQTCKAKKPKVRFQLLTHSSSASGSQQAREGAGFPMDNHHLGAVHQGPLSPTGLPWVTESLDHLGWKQPSRSSQPSRSRSSPTIKLTYCVPLLRHIHTSLKCLQAKGFRHSLGSPF